MIRLHRALIASALLGALALVPHTPALAGGTVDASMLNPVPASDYSCQADGKNVICRVTRHRDIASEVSDQFPTTCSGRPIYESVQETGQITRYYTWESSGYNGPGFYLTRRINHDDEVQVLSLSPDISAPTVTWISHETGVTVFGTPGDFSTATTTWSGLDAQANLPGMGWVFHESGRVVYDSADGGDLISVHGPRQLDLDMDAVMARLCPALGAP